jgi:hypothetical protein
MTMAYESELELEDELEGESEGELEDELEGEGFLGSIGNVLGGLLGESEDEFETEPEWEEEDEFESEVSPVRKIYPDAMMEHLAHMAAEAESEEEAAEQFLPLIGLAAKKLLPMVAKAVAPSLKRALPKVARAVTRLEPRLTRGVTTIARNLYRQPGTRRLLHAVPSIARRTVHSIASKVAHGQPLTARGAIRTLAHQAKRVLGNRGRRLHTLRHSQRLDHRLHRHMGPGHMRRYGRLGHPGYRGGVAAPGAPGLYPRARQDVPEPQRVRAFPQRAGRARCAGVRVVQHPLLRRRHIAVAAVK